MLKLVMQLLVFVGTVTHFSTFINEQKIQKDHIYSFVILYISILVVLQLTHADPCSAHFCMSPLFVTPDSDHQLVRWELHELNWVLRCIKALSSSKNFIPTPNIELYYAQCETLYPAASPLRATTLPSAKLASVSSTGTGFSKVDVILYQFSSR